MEMPQIYRPIPRRGFEITPASADSSHPPSPATEPIGQEQNSSHRVDTMPSRTRSILNLTSSTLLGIYSPIGSDAGREESSTPWGTGAQTPTQRGSVDHTPQLSPLTWTGDSAKPVLPQKRKGLRGFILPLFLQTMLLFGSGIGYGSLITHLHRTQHITPIPVPHIERNTLYYQLSWGVFGILLGNALPIVDSLWETTISPAINGGRATQRSTSGATKASNHDSTNANSAPDSGLGPMWYSAVRSIGVFVGIAFAMRRLPWQSTLQVALTLALANPVLWYLIDRSLPGFAFSAAVSLIGTLLLLLVDPNFVPVPAIHQPMASEKFGVYTWLASILFCTSICFGAIGRRLRL